MKLSDELINWYRTYKRDLPWRNTTDAYLIWLSEIILQQTRVDQGMPYYHRFSSLYPNIKSFSEASEDEILRLWQGLGYYSRGRNMLKTAKKIMQDYKGVFPTSYKELITLTGIGEYTAAAISSFSVNEPKAVVDGNVYRLLSRYYGIFTPINSNLGKKQFQEIANEALDNENAAENNQAIIEFGALQCKPKNPNCNICPLQNSCFAFNNKCVNELPVKLKKLKVKERFFNYFLIIDEDKILIKRRDNSDIWAGLHDLPMIETQEQQDLIKLFQHEEFKKWFPNEIEIGHVSSPVKHILTHQRIYATFIEIKHFNLEVLPENNWFWLNINDLNNIAQPKLIFAYLKNLSKLS
jgi:A/G-specific adenine glycosylase